MKYLIYLLITLNALNARASDHDDGEIELKGRNLNITDVYAFQEASQTGSSADAGNLILIMNTNPRSLPGQEYFFSSKAYYEFHLSRVVNKKAKPNGASEIVIGVKFREPKNGQQQMNVYMNSDGIKTSAWDATDGKPILTTAINNSSADKLIMNEVDLGQKNITVFAGLREDPFFFDVEQFFKVRTRLAVSNGKEFIGFKGPSEARDFTKNYNVNSIVLRVPISLLQKNKEKVFDVWARIAIDSKIPGKKTQLERLARPGINEGLVLTNASLNRWNQLSPRYDLTNANSWAIKEAGAVLTILSNLGKQPANHVTNVVNGFLPDVMRIDSSVTIPVGKSGYIGDFVVNDAGAPMLTGGRKIEDDVIDHTLSYLVGGLNGLLKTAVKDGVSYQGADENPSQGHKMLHGQKSYGGQASFPFLATPN